MIQTNYTYYTVLYPNAIKSRTGEFEEIIGHHSVGDATYYAFNKTRGKIAIADLIDIADGFIYTVEEGVVSKEKRVDDNKNYVEFVVLHCDRN